MRRLLAAAATEKDLILVGGQALAFWMLHYGIQPDDGDQAITRDVDFFTPSAADRSAVKKFAHALGGTCYYPNERTLTALVGQVIRRDSLDRYINVDVIFKTIGIPSAELQKYAIDVTIKDIGIIRVIDPITVLKSRVENLYRLNEKQNVMGIEQSKWAIRIVQRYMQSVRTLIKDNVEVEARDPMLKKVGRVLRIAESSAGKGVSVRFGIHAADAIEPGLVNNAAFHEKRLPQVLSLMSDQRRAEIVTINQRLDDTFFGIV